MWFLTVCSVVEPAPCAQLPIVGANTTAGAVIELEQRVSAYFCQDYVRIKHQCLCSFLHFIELLLV